MFQKLFFIGFFLFTSINVFSQDTDMVVEQHKVPSSIYVENDDYSFLKASVTKDLKLKSFKFLIFDEENLMRNSFAIDLRNIGRQSSKFSYESYKDFDLYKHFQVVPDIITLNRFNKNVSIKAN